MKKVLEQEAWEKHNYTNAARRPGDLEQIYADTKIANTELGWKA